MGYNSSSVAYLFYSSDPLGLMKAVSFPPQNLTVIFPFLNLEAINTVKM
jgi:hypothetical protein